LELSIKNIEHKNQTKIIQISKRINEIANDLLDCFVNNKLVIPQSLKKTIAVPLLPLVREVYNEFKIRQDKSKLFINFEYPIQELIVSVHPEEFKRSLANIINNAIESFGDEIQGCIEIRLISIHGFIELIIQDNGCGIPAEKLNEIFLEGISINKKNGVGIGLSYVKNVVKSWGADYKITSQVEKGTEFKYVFENKARVNT